MVGCGNSKMSEEMARDGFDRITNVDISPVVIEKMQMYYSKTRVISPFEFMTIDATDMPYRSNCFDFCVDKGTYDALACGVD